MNRFKLAAALALLLFVAPGCMGRMVVSSNVHDFNMNVVEDRWGRELLFVGFYIIPVYPTCAFLDLCVFNAIEFWSGENFLNGESALVDE